MTQRRWYILPAALLAAAGVLIALLPAWSTGNASSSTATQEASSTQPGTATQPGVATRPAEPYERPLPPASREHERLRHRMVETQIEAHWDGRPAVKDEQVLEAMRAAPRHVFVPDRHRGQAYRDMPLPIGHGQTISQPYIVALMTELLELTSESKVLEIGTGSGYQAAVLAHLTPHVYSIEIIEPLAENAQEVLEAQGYDEAQCRHGDGYHGWPEAAPFDTIIVTAAAGHLPPPLWEQLAPGGRIVIPIGDPMGVQRLVVVTKTPEGKRETRSVMPVRFVPLTRAGSGE